MRIIAVILAALCGFFIFYTVRLFAVTDLLQQTRAGGSGAYIGAVAFPVLAVAFGWTSRRCWRQAKRGPAA